VKFAQKRTKLTYEKCSFSAVSDFEKSGEVAAGECRWTGQYDLAAVRRALVSARIGFHRCYERPSL
jgi:hypothetical protein